MELKKEIRILGRRFEGEPRAKESLKGITVSMMAHTKARPCCSLSPRRAIPLHGLAPSRASG